MRTSGPYRRRVQQVVRPAATDGAAGGGRSPFALSPRLSRSLFAEVLAPSRTCVNHGRLDAGVEKCAARRTRLSDIVSSEPTAPGFIGGKVGSTGLPRKHQCHGRK